MSHGREHKTEPKEVIIFLVIFSYFLKAVTILLSATVSLKFLLETIQKQTLYANPKAYCQCN